MWPSGRQSSGQLFVQIRELMSGHGTDVTHQQAHASALQDIWNPHAALRLPKMHELPPLDTQLIPASLAKAFGIQLTHGDDDGGPGRAAA